MAFRITSFLRVLRSWLQARLRSLHVRGQVYERQLRSAKVSLGLGLSSFSSCVPSMLFSEEFWLGRRKDSKYTLLVRSYGTVPSGLVFVAS